MQSEKLCGERVIGPGGVPSELLGETEILSLCVQEEVAAPEEFLCPISLQLMSAPVKCLQTQMIYDRSSFHAWLAQGTAFVCSCASTLSDASIASCGQHSTRTLGSQSAVI